MGNSDKKHRITPLSVTVILAALGILCLAAKALLPEYIDAAGILHEAFYLLPLGFLFLAAAVVTGLIALIRRLIRRRN